LIPQLMVFFIMVGSAGPYFDTSSSSVGSSAVIRGNQISFFFLSFNVSILYPTLSPITTDSSRTHLFGPCAPPITSSTTLKTHRAS
jgi:hypothetical protein